MKVRVAKYGKLTLRRTQLTLVNDVVGCQGTDVELILESDFMTGVLSQNVKLPSEVRMVKFAPFLRVVRVPSVVVCKHDEGLQDLGLPAAARRTKDGSVRGHRSPTEDTKSELLCNVFERALLVGERCSREKDISDGVFSESGQSRKERVRGLAEEEFVRNAIHSSCPITVSSIGSS